MPVRDIRGGLSRDTAAPDLSSDGGIIEVEHPHSEAGLSQIGAQIA